jgi:N-methylhydantoinase A
MSTSEALLAPLLDEAGMTFSARRIEHALDMHYQGQTHTVSVPVPAALDEASLAAAFAAVYAGAYGGLLPHVPIRVMNLRTTLIGERPPIDLMSLAPAADASLEASRRPSRQVWFGGWTEAAIHDRLALPTGTVIAGPAVLQQPDATILVEPGQQARVDRFGNLILEMLP